MTNQQLIGYIGTYTKGESKGIYSFILNTEEAEIQDLTVAAVSDNPTYLTISPNNQYIYSVVKEGESGGVAAFKISENPQHLEYLNRQTEMGAPPCFVSTDINGKVVLSANYHKGSVEAYFVKEDGSLRPASSVMTHSGSGPDSRQEKAHAHYMGMTPDEKYAVAVDLGTDELITYLLTEGRLTQKAVFHFNRGSGPRHLVFHPSGKIAYVMTEFSSEVVVLAYNAADGTFAQLQTISTIPEEFTENNQGSAIHISADGRFVYAGNRGHDSIAVFSTDEQASELSFVERVSTYGNWPRDFVLDPTENFVIAANQNSSNLVLYKRCTDTGRLTMLNDQISVPDPVCVKFLAL